MAVEVELKLATSKAGLRKALALPWLRKMAGDSIKQQHLVSTYFDTRDLALRDRGVSLRIRRIGGQRLQTIKASSAVPMARSEWETKVNRDRPELELIGHTDIAPIFTGAIARRLKPMFETRIERTAMSLKIGRSDIELALDEGRVAALDNSVDLAEIEIELKQGEHRDVAVLARKLAREIPLTFAARAKADWGYAVVEDSVSAATSGGAVTLAPSATTADAFVIIGFHCLRQVAANELAVRHGDGEGIHWMRVGLRRLRAALSLFKDLLYGKETGGIKSELKWLTAQLGPGRDADVFVSKTAVHYLDRCPNRSEFEVLAHDLERARNAGFAKARAAVESDRYRRLLLDCALWLIDGDWRNDTDDLRRALRERPARMLAEEELGRRTRKIVKRARKLLSLNATKRHELRIAVKKLRYGRQFFASLNTDSGRRKMRRKVDRTLKALQAALGNLNDIRAHTSWAHDFARANAVSRKAFAAGYLTGREEARASDVLAEAIDAGKRLKALV
ncbi:MAG: CHAD domain-containing protein [Bradyrhizobium sp.]|nr:CHAD domain-containing protein [Bradyrhizobium sp.]